MATFKQKESGQWQAQVAKDGVRKAKSFKTKREAQDWATRIEYLISQGELGGSSQTLAALFDRYARTVSPKKRGAKWEHLRLEKIAKDKIGKVKLDTLSPKDFASWRDRRLLDVSPGTVNREMVLMSSVLTLARKEWGLIKSNPLADVSKPSKPPARDRLVTEDELKALIAATGTSFAKPGARSVHAFRFALETAMRAGEIIGLTWADVNRETRVALLPMTKSGTARKVPLSTAALALLDELPETDGPIFGLTSQQLDACFRQKRRKAKIDGLTFHDSRHSAITRLAKKFDVLPLARIVGHNDIRMLQVYYNETAEELAALLD